jgi:hypothetical protein
VLEHRSWLEAIRAGRTFVTNGPIVGLGVQRDGPAGGRWFGIGDEVALPEGTHPLRFQLTLRSNTPVDHLELVRNGKVVADIPLRGERTRADTAIIVPVTESGWYVLRTYADRPATPILDLYPFASTSPVYVTVGGQPVRSREDAEYFITWIDRVKQEVEKHEGWNTREERDSVLTTIARAREEFERRR